MKKIIVVLLLLVFILGVPAVLRASEATHEYDVTVYWLGESVSSISFVATDCQSTPQDGYLYLTCSGFGTGNNQWTKHIVYEGIAHGYTMFDTTTPH